MANKDDPATTEKPANSLLGFTDGWHSHWIDIDSIKLRAVVRNAEGEHGHQPPLLILGGMGARLEVMLPIADALPNRAIVLLDPPGIGQSSTPHWPINMVAYARLVSAVLDQLNYSQVDILGYSWGGALAQQFAIQHGIRCRRLVMAAASTGVFSPAAKTGVMLKYLNPRRLIESDYVCQIAGELYGGTQKTDPTIAIEYARSIHAGNRWGYYLQLTAIMHWSSLHWLHKLTQHALILAGSDDPLIPLSVAKNLHRRIPKSRLEVFDDGHLFLLSQAQEVCPLIDAFLCED